MSSNCAIARDRQSFDFPRPRRCRLFSRPGIAAAHSHPNMFRTAPRRFAASLYRSAESLSQLEASYQTGINISKAQGIGQRGFIDGRCCGAHDA